MFMVEICRKFFKLALKGREDLFFFYQACVYENVMSIVVGRGCINGWATWTVSLGWHHVVLPTGR